MKGTFPRGNKLYPAHYALLYFTKGTPKTFNRVRLPIPTCRHCGKDIKDYGGHRKYLNPAGLNLTDIWDDTSPARHSKNKSRWHVNELKPTIPERCIQISTNPCDIVLDPFGGGGSTYVTAERLHRFWIGTEIGPCEPILERFEREFLVRYCARPRLAIERLEPLAGVGTKGNSSRDRSRIETRQPWFIAEERIGLYRERALVLAQLSDRCQLAR